MKKVTLIIGVLAMIGLNSCKKDWTCICTDQSGNQTPYLINNQTILNARNQCKAKDYTNTTLGTSQSCSIQ